MIQSEEQIHSLCKLYNITNYIINDDGSIDVNGNIDLSTQRIYKLPLIFNKVSGHFDCSYNKLTSFKGCPIIVVGDFHCNDNQLTSLMGCPDKINGHFDCSYNELTTLDGCSIEIGEGFDCSNNNLSSLKGCPKIVGGNFYCNYNKLTTLNSIPLEIAGDSIYISYNLLHSFYHLVNINLGNKMTIFVKYMDHYDVFNPMFNEQNGLDLIEEIKDGLK